MQDMEEWDMELDLDQTPIIIDFDIFNFIPSNGFCHNLLKFRKKYFLIFHN